MVKPRQSMVSKRRRMQPAPSRPPSTHQAPPVISMRRARFDAAAKPSSSSLALERRDCAAGRGSARSAARAAGGCTLKATNNTGKRRQIDPDEADPLLAREAQQREQVGRDHEGRDRRQQARRSSRRLRNSRPLGSSLALMLVSIGAAHSSFSRRARHGQHPVRLDRLGQVLVRAERQRAVAILLGALGGDHDDRDLLQGCPRRGSG